MRLVVLLAIAAAAVVPRPAAAQIVNVQGQLARAPTTDGVTGQVELKLEWREGNSPYFAVGGSGALLVRHGRWLGLALARGDYARGRGLVLTQKAFEHLRVRATLDRRWRWELFGQHEYDAFRRLSVRALTGTGPALQLVDGERRALLAGLAYLLEYERLDRRAGTVDAGATSFTQRASMYLTGSQRLGDDVTVVETVYVQPRLADVTDLRLLGEASITSKLSRRLALTNGLNVTYDRTPPDGIGRGELQLKLGLLVTF